MSAQSFAAPATAVPGDRAPTRDPLAAHIITALTASTLAFLVLLRPDAFREAIMLEWQTLAPWAILIAIVNLLPLRIEDFSLTLDLPLLLAVAISVSPEGAATVAFVATLDAREVGVSRIGFSRALFNRAQVALCVLVAGWVFHLVAQTLAAPVPAALGICVALLVDYLLNTGLVATHLAARRSMSLLTSARKLTVGSSQHFLATYLGFGVMALVIAYLNRALGFWPVLAFLIPIMVARHALLRDMALERARHRLVLQSELLERALDRSVEEREDERVRVAEELHDELLQSLFALRMSVAAIGESTPSISRDQGNLVARLDEAIHRLRSIIRGLEHSPLGATGFGQSIEGLIRDLRRDWARSISLTLPGEVCLPNSDQVLLYQMIREGILNALKHSESQEVSVAVWSSDEGTVAVVQDYGIGFCAEPHRPSHFGLELMRRRADRLGAQLIIRSEPGKGTRLSITIPGRDEPRASS